MALLRIHVTPKSGSDEVSGWRGDELGVRVRAVPEDGKATRAASRVIADSLGISKSAVRVVRGHTSRHKTLEIEGVGPKDLVRRFGSPEDSLF